MTWTYDIGILATSGKDQVRLLIGDTYTGDQQIQDEEIEYFLMQRATSYGAAAECCRSLQAKLSRSVDQGSGTNKVSYSQMAKAYGVKAAEFEAKAAMSGAGAPYAGAMSISDKIAQESDNDRVAPQFQIGMDENLILPAVGDSGSESLTSTSQEN